MDYNFTRREVYMPEKHFRKDRHIELTPNENIVFSLLWINKDSSRSYEELAKSLYGIEKPTKYEKNNIRRIIYGLRKKGINIQPLSKYGYKLKEDNK